MSCIDKELKTSYLLHWEMLMSCRDKELIRISYIVLRYVDDLRIDKEFINTSYYCIEKRLGAV